MIISSMIVGVVTLLFSPSSIVSLLEVQTWSRMEGRKGWTRKVPSKKPQLMKKWRALMKGLLFSGPSVNTRRMLSAVRNRP